MVGDAAGLTGATAGPFLDAGLRYFLAVAQAGSIAEASAELHVAASAISRQITRLEHEVGVALFERQPRGMVLSDAGVRLAAFVRRNVADLEHVIGEIRGVVLCALKATYYGPMGALMANLFPAGTRATGMALGYNIGVAVFGGFTPFIATWLIATTGSDLAPSFWVMLTAALSLIALVTIRRRLALR